MESKTWEARSLASSQSNTKDVLASSSGPLFLCFVSPLQNLGNVNKIKKIHLKLKRSSDYFHVMWVVFVTMVTDVSLHEDWKVESEIATEIIIICGG